MNASVSICGEIYNQTEGDCPVAFGFEINLSVGEGTFFTPTVSRMIFLYLHFRLCTLDSCTKIFCLILENFLMVFGPCHRNHCVNVPIDNDNQVEGTRTFTYRLERTEDLDSRIQISSSTGRLTIIDDPSDSKWMYLNVFT